MNEKMEFPNTFEEFLNEYSFKDSDEVYTNGSDLIQTFRVMQGYEHFRKQGKADGAREFAEWLCGKYSRIGQDSIGFEIFKNIYWKPIDEVLAEWQKGAENDK